MVLGLSVVFLVWVQLFATASMRMAMCCFALGKNNANSMTVANGGNAIEDSFSVGSVYWKTDKSRIFSFRWGSVGK